MIVGILKVDLFIPDSTSLKVKRSAIKSLKDRLRSRFNVSVAELDHNEKWQRASIGVTVISNDGKHVVSVLGNVMNLIYGDRRVEVLDATITYV